MPYAVVGIETDLAWPSIETSIQFDSQALTLRPGSSKHYPSVYTRYEPDTPEASAAAHSLLRRFLSALAWSGEGPVRDVVALGGGFPVNAGRLVELSKERETFSGAPLRWEPPVNYLPQPPDRRARLALALYREALGLEHTNVPYAFLGFAKILNIAGNGKAQIDWINGAIANMTDYFAKPRLAKIQASEPNVGEYLYASGRCAVAHAANNPVVDPDDASDTLRLGRDLPVMKALAKHFIEKEFGVRTRSTIYSQHLYELEGFHELLGVDLVTHVRNVGTGEGVTAPQIPALSVRIDLEGRGDEAEFTSLRPIKLTFTGRPGVVFLFCASPDGRLEIALSLDFADERLGFDPERDVLLRDDGSVETIDHEMMRLRFLRGMILNGRTEVRDAATGRRIGRTDPCVPMNIDSHQTIVNLEKLMQQAEATRAVRAAALTITNEPPSTTA